MLRRLRSRFLKPLVPTQAAVEGRQLAQVDAHEIPAALHELNRMVGLDAVKPEINALIEELKGETARRERKVPIAPHMVFAGRQGVGKSEVARLYGAILRDLGVLKKGHVIEADRQSLVSGYIGQSAQKTKERIQAALDGILYIDAYPLIPASGEIMLPADGEIMHDFGLEAVETLLKEMEHHRDRIVVIIAGYPKQMERFIATYPGARSRFTKVIGFSNYDADQMVAITHSLARRRGLGIDPPAVPIMKSYFAEVAMRQDFANGWTALILLERAQEAREERIGPRQKEGATIDMKELTAGDFGAAIALADQA
jgi:stage V sporulation protein K